MTGARPEGGVPPGPGCQGDRVDAATSYHLGFVVTDLDAAAAQLSGVTGVTWRPARRGRLGPWDYRITFSVQGPPYLELVEGPAGSPWDASGGPRLDHLGYWCEAIDAARDALAGQGLPAEVDATVHGRPFTYHRLDQLGVRLELVEESQQRTFVETWEAHGAVVPPLRP